MCAENCKLWILWIRSLIFKYLPMKRVNCERQTLMWKLKDWWQAIAVTSGNVGRRVHAEFSYIFCCISALLLTLVKYPWRCMRQAGGFCIGGVTLTASLSTQRAAQVSRMNFLRVMAYPLLAGEYYWGRKAASSSGYWGTSFYDKFHWQRASYLI